MRRSRQAGSGAAPAVFSFCRLLLPVRRRFRKEDAWHGPVGSRAKLSKRDYGYYRPQSQPPRKPPLLVLKIPSWVTCAAQKPDVQTSPDTKSWVHGLASVSQGTNLGNVCIRARESRKWLMCTRFMPSNNSFYAEALQHIDRPRSLGTHAWSCRVRLQTRSAYILASPGAFISLS